ncbi:MAG: alpha-L-fucosidase [Sphingobacteriales bacterium]|nr:alpha-L-fucosidase [Sphingobacteriales bacterium]
MKKVCLLLFFCLPALAPEAQVYAPNWESLDKRPVPQWYQDAKFGIFIHWGVYSVPAFRTKGEYAEWYQNGLNSGDTAAIAFHKRQYGDLTYYQLADRFRAALFNPDDWAHLIEKSGARYVVLTSKHHDGFALWPSKEATRDWGFPWNAVEAGPHRDLLGDLFTALRKTSVHPGLYYSLYEWYNPIWLKDHKQYVAQHEWPQMKDLVNNYKPEVFWTDGEWDETAETWKSQEFLAWLYNESPIKDKVVTYDRWGKGVRFKHGGVFTPEYQPDVSFADHYYEESRGMGYSYGYNRNEDAWDYNSAETMIGQLVDKTSGGGNFLLDIGPDADGKIPPIMQERLLQIGEWMETNHEAIYNTSRWRTPRQTDASGKPECFFTYNKNTKDLFVILPHWPGSSFTIKDLAIAPGTRIELLESRQILNAHQNGKDLEIEFPVYDPATIKSKYYYTMRLAGAGDFADNPRLDLQYPGNLLKPIVNISVRDGSQIRYTLDGSIPDENATLFTKPFTAQQSAVLTTRSFRPGALPGNILVAPLTVYPLLPAAHPAAKKQGLQLTRYELIPETVKDLDKTTPIGDTVSSRPSINDLSRADNAGLLYTGYVQAPRDALYTWYLSVDDGAVLWIDGQLVIDHDGKHANTEKSGKIALKKGPHVFKLAYIQAGSDKALKLEYSANGIERQELPATAWVHE